MILSKNKNYLEILLSFSIIFFVLINFRYISNDNMIYGIGQIHSMNPMLFNNNIYLGNGIITPRFISDYLFAFLMKFFNNSWIFTANFVILLSILITSFSFALIINKIVDKYKLFFSLAFITVLLYFKNYLAGFSIIAVQSTSIGLSLSFAILAISLLISGAKIVFCYIFAAIALILHIHEGIYCVSIIFIFHVINIIVNKSRCYELLYIVIPICCILIIFIPNIITDKLNISNSEFVSIYSLFRHPHHLVPSEFGIKNIFYTFSINILLFCISLYITFKFNRSYFKFRLILYITIMLSWIFALLIMYIFTEIIPLAFISTMFISKYFKYVYFIALIYFIESCNAIIKYINFRYFFLVEIAFSFIILYFKFNIFIIPTILLIIFTLFENSTHFIFTRLLVLLFAIIFIVFNGKFVAFNKNNIFLISEKTLYLELVDDDLYDIACKFSHISKINDMYLSDPYNQDMSGWFQIISQRNCYAIEKVVPSNKMNIEKWYYRLVFANNIFNGMSQDDCEDIRNIHNCDYILVNSRHFELLDSYKFLSIVLRSKNDKYRVYKIII